jgi:prefoldin subunit 5
VNRKLESAITDLNCANKESETFIENLKERFEDLKSKEERLARKVEGLR